MIGLCSLEDFETTCIKRPQFGDYVKFCWFVNVTRREDCVRDVEAKAGVEAGVEVKAKVGVKTGIEAGEEIELEAGAKAEAEAGEEAGGGWLSVTRQEVYKHLSILSSKYTLVLLTKDQCSFLASKLDFPLLLTQQ